MKKLKEIDRLKALVDAGRPLSAEVVSELKRRNDVYISYSSTARLLLNLRLIQAEYPPIAFPPELDEKLRYLKSLETADGGDDISQFADLVCDRVIVALSELIEIIS